MSHPSVAEVISALASAKNVLLYGPPGTGKTWLVTQVVAFLRERGSAGGRPTLRVGETPDQFGTAEGRRAGELPRNLEIEWVTFHQSYSYEEFILGRRPKPEGAGIILEPHFGLLMSIAIRIQQPGGPPGCLLIIDELNRANASQVFGEFITLLDPDYRSTIGGASNPHALRVRLPGIAYEGGVSEPVRMLREGGTFNLPHDWTFPEHVYVLATMNSVDKAALPLDSALTRRFHRIEMRPDIGLLAQNLGVDLEALHAKARSIRVEGQGASALTAEEVSVLLLDRINVSISSDMGEDFEIGHSFFWPVVRSEPSRRWQSLVSAWDRNIFPQIMERYAGRTDALRELLKVAPGSKTQPAFQERGRIGSEVETDAPLKLNPLSRLTPEAAREVLTALAI
jgi:5-methylcytosine-specific restriction protein B